MEGRQSEQKMQPERKSTERQGGCVSRQPVTDSQSHNAAAPLPKNTQGCVSAGRNDERKRSGEHARIRRTLRTESQRFLHPFFLVVKGSIQPARVLNVQFPPHQQPGASGTGARVYLRGKREGSVAACAFISCYLSGFFPRFD